MSEAASTERDVSTETLAGMVLAAMRDREGTALRYREDGEWAELSYADLGQRVRELARGLIALGVEPGDRVAIFSDTCVEWTLCDLAALCAGAVVVSVYPTSPAEEARHVLDDSGPGLVFCGGPKQLAAVEELREELTGIEHVVTFAGEPEGALTLDQLAEHGTEVDEGQVDQRAEAVSSDDLFALIYTSGTTGPAKGCMLTHGAYRANCDMLARAIEPGEDAVVQIGLPLAHTFTRMMQMLAISVGAELAFWSGDRERLLDDLAEIQPTHYPASPRIFEKLYNQAQSQLPPEGVKGTLFDKFLETGRRVEDRRRAGESTGPLLKLGHALADNELLSDVRELFGARLRLAITGAAAAPVDVLEFFYASGVLIVEGYGLTETSTATALNTPDALRFGTVGRPLEGSEVRIADEDGEVLVRGPHIFRGYWNDEEATSSAFNEDGWLHTGDLGSIDEDGYLSITGRKKDILVTSSGENIPASMIEERIARSRWISNAVVYGDDKHYLVALVTIDDEERDALADETGTRDVEREKMARQMAEDKRVRRVIKGAIDEANEGVAPIQQVKSFTILEHGLSEEGGELTPTWKVKRSVVHERYRDRFEALYEEGDEG